MRLGCARAGQWGRLVERWPPKLRNACNWLQLAGHFHPAFLSPGTSCSLSSRGQRGRGPSNSGPRTLGHLPSFCDGAPPPPCFGAPWGVALVSET